MTLKVWILYTLTRLFIILVSLTISLFSEKMLIFNRCISGLMSNLIKKSWTVSIVESRYFKYGSRIANECHRFWDFQRTYCKVFLTVVSLVIDYNVLKPGQNKKGQKIFQLHRFLNTFLQLTAKKKYSKNGAAGNFFGPSYFVTVLTRIWSILLWKCLEYCKVVLNKKHKKERHRQARQQKKNKTYI